jgi:hypothetical protein
LHKKSKKRKTASVPKPEPKTISKNVPKSSFKIGDAVKPTDDWRDNDGRIADSGTKKRSRSKPTGWILGEYKGIVTKIFKDGTLYVKYARGPGTEGHRKYSAGTYFEWTHEPSDLEAIPPPPFPDEPKDTKYKVGDTVNAPRNDPNYKYSEWATIVQVTDKGYYIEWEDGKSAFFPLDTEWPGHKPKVKIIDVPE